MGLPIGPDTSWLLSELLMIRVEEHVREQIPGISGYRYIDDFEFICDSGSSAENIILHLEEALSTYELSLNPKKTSIQPLPDRLEAEGIAELRRWTFSSHPRGQTKDTIDYFDRLSDLRTEDPETSASAYGLTRLRGVNWTTDAWSVAQARAASFAINEPSVLRAYAGLLKSGRTRGLSIDNAVLGTVINQVIQKAAPLGRDSEVAWALWLAIEHKVRVTPSACSVIEKLRESCSVLLALMADELNLLKVSPDRSKWKDILTPDSLQGRFWLLSYEATHQGWLPTTGNTDHRLEDAFFTDLVDHNISFLNLNASTPTPSYTAPRVNGGGAEALYIG
jgi:hypothetical protein